MPKAGPSKRPRRTDDVDGDDEVEIESASSSFRQRTNKRTKVAVAREIADDTEDDGYADAFLEEGDSFASGANGDIHSDTEMDSDAEDNANLHHTSDDSEDEDEITFMATQVISKEMQRTRNNIAWDHGIIEEIFCRNFMCHSKLRIALGPNINFIIGHNGSGKSAVLTALTMCLGAKASQTNRAPNMKSLIKEGHDSAMLAVKIKNEGEDAFKPDEYGRSITVERYFTRSGTSGFKLKSENDKIISQKRSDLDDILDYFGLQLDNPINVLTQDLARQFLSNSTPEQKYKFFLRGTMLEALDNDYKLMELNLDLTEEKLRILKDDLVVLKQKHDEAKQRKQAASALKNMQNRIAQINRMYAWSQVEEQEQLCQRFEGDVARAQAEVSAKEEAAGSVDARFEAAEARFEAEGRSVTHHQEQLGPAKEKWTAAKTDLDANKEKLANFKTDERQMKTSRKKAIEDISRLERAIRAEEDLLAGQGGEAHVRRQAELEELRAAVTAAKEEQVQHSSQHTELEHTRNSAQTRFDHAESTLAEAKTARQAAEGNLSAIQRDENRKYAPYIQNMEQLCREIDRETRWRAKPVGPFGMHIQLKKPEWSSILEATFGGTLNAFAVTHKDDADIFNSLAKRVRCNASVFIGRSEPLDTTGKEPASNVDTILRVLTFKSEIVRNQLIINQGIDQAVLIKDGAEARSYMYDNGRPENVRSTMSLKNGHAGVAGHRWTYTRVGAQRSDPVNHWRGAPRMQTDRGQRLEIAHERVTSAERDLDDAQQRRNQARQVLTKAEQALQAHNREQKRLKLAIQNAEDAVEGKEAEIENNRPKDGKLQELQRQLVEARGEQQAQTDSLSDLYEQKAVYDEKAPTLLAAANEAKDELDTIETRITQAEKKVTEASAARHEILLEKNEAHEQVNDAKKIVERLELKVTKQKEEVATYIREATEVSARIAVEPAGVEPDYFQKQIDNLERQYAREHAKLGAGEEELAREFARTHQEWKVANARSREMVRDARLFKDTLKDRHYRWRKFLQYISTRARTQFQYLLSERNFRGRVLLDHEGKKLDIAVEPDLARTSDAGREARTLSGGEKSFSTICLLLSIWEAMGSPIRCLDEFDVFMDSVNRAQSMDLMVKAARRSAGRQYILITPQAMNNVELGDDVKIHKMSDPERGQTNLTFNGREL